MSADSAPVLITKNDPSQSACQNEIFIARQPIFNAQENVDAYELLFRSNLDNHAMFIDGNVASGQVIVNSFVDMDIDAITENKLVFVNLTRDFLTGKLPLPLPPNVLVVEILEDVVIDDEVLQGVKKLSERGYTIALDDYVFGADKAALFEHIDIIKVDIRECDLSQLARQAAELKAAGVKLLAEKVETREEYSQCIEAGFELFQGYYFSKPTLISGQAIRSNRMSLLRVLATLEDPTCSIEVIEDRISQDVSLSYKMLRIVNSAFYNMKREIESVKQAVVVLGLDTVRDWMVIIMLTDIDDKPSELIALCLQRAKTMQLLADDYKLSPDSCFTIGLLSSIDAILDQPMETILTELPLSTEITEALLTSSGQAGSMLGAIKAFERGEWEFVVKSAFNAKKISECYLQSIVWTRDLYEQIKIS